MGSYRFKDIQLPQLRSFCLVALEGSFTRAAKALGISVPAVWDRVRALERQLGAPLLRWHDQTVELTRDGRLVLELVQPHVTGIDSLARLLEQRRAELPDELTVASIQYLLDYHLPGVIREFSTAHPSVSLRVLAHTMWSDMFRFVEENEAELGLSIYDPADKRSPYLDYEDLFEMEFMLLTPADHPLSRKKRISPADIADQPLILTPLGRRHLEHVLRRERRADRLRVVLETNSTYTVLKYVALGVGISAGFADRQMAQATPGVHVRHLDPEKSLAVAMLVGKGAHLSESAQAFRALVRRRLRQPPSR